MGCTLNTEKLAITHNIAGSITCEGDKSDLRKRITEGQTLLDDLDDANKTKTQAPINSNNQTVLPPIEGDKKEQDFFDQLNKVKDRADTLKAIYQLKTDGTRFAAPIYYDNIKSCLDRKSYDKTGSSAWDYMVECDKEAIRSTFTAAKVLSDNGNVQATQIFMTVKSLEKPYQLPQATVDELESLPEKAD